MTGGGPPPVRIVRDEDDGATDVSHHVFARVSNEDTLILAAVLNEALELSDDMGNGDDDNDDDDDDDVGGERDNQEPDIGDYVRLSLGSQLITATTTQRHYDRQGEDDEQPEGNTTQNLATRTSSDESTSTLPTTSGIATTSLVASVSGESRRSAHDAENHSSEKNSSSPPPTTLRNDQLTTPNRQQPS